MAVENVNSPKRVTAVNPKDAEEKGADDVRYWERQKEMTRARREAITEQKELDSLENPPDQSPPFQIRGGINLGEIDLQEEQRKAKEESDRVRAASEDRIAKLESALTEAREALHSANLNNLKDNLTGQIDSLKKAIESGGAKGDIGSQLASVKNIAEQYLGANFGGGNGGGGGGSDLNTVLAIKKLDAEIKREERRFQLEQKRDERLWQMELRKMDDARIAAERSERTSAQRWKVIERLPDMLGESFADAQERRAAIAAGRQPVTRDEVARTKAAEQSGQEMQEIECDACKTHFQVPAAATKAVCPNCKAELGG